MTRPDVRARGESGRGHVVQFYATDDELVADAVEHFAAALIRGGTAIAIATEPHCQAFLAELTARGLGAVALDRLQLLDADGTMQRFLVDGKPDAHRFDEVIGALVRPADRPVHAYGEMVAVLWAAGRIQEAIELESMWNAAGERYPFLLLCGYPAETCLWEEQGEALAMVCGLHDEISGSAAPRLEREGRAATSVERTLPLPRESASVRRARAEVRGLLAELPPAEREVAELIASELVANALEHARGEVFLRLAVEEAAVRISVDDEDPTQPRLRPADHTSPRGRGLQIVSALAQSWGVTSNAAGGKSVWAELQVGGSPAS